MKNIFLCITAVLVLCCGGFALDEAILTPTRGTASFTEEKAFNDAMEVWFSHKYNQGEEMLEEFAAKYPDSRWRAEAELHRGCFFTYTEDYTKAKTLFNDLAEEFRGTEIETKAMIRLANIDEFEAKTADAIAKYSSVLSMNPTWDQFKYANYRARKLMMTQMSNARVACGPVGLAACLDATGQESYAKSAKEIKVTDEGISLAQLQAHCENYGIPAKSVKMGFDKLKDSKLPVLAYVEPKHFVAVIDIEEDKIHLEDSVRGKYTLNSNELSEIWGGKVLSFTPVEDMVQLALVDSLQTIGGCCGQAAEDECLGFPGQCQQGTYSSDGCDEPCPSVGRPTWQLNTNNLNLLVRDTPIYYNPGKGPAVTFTLTYSNENSNTGIFGKGWRSLYDMKVFFLPSSHMVYDPETYRYISDPDHPTLQVHRDNGRIETYEWYNSEQKYLPRGITANYGYRDTIEYDSSGVVTLHLREGGKYIFKSSDLPNEHLQGRIHKIVDKNNLFVECGYDNEGRLESITDANGRITEIGTDEDATGIDERVLEITLPDDEYGSDGRSAIFTYDSLGNLVSITDMLGDTSTLNYKALAKIEFSDYMTMATTGIVTYEYPENGEDLMVVMDNWSYKNWPDSGSVLVMDEERITYEGKEMSFLKDVRRENPMDFSQYYTGVRLVPSITTLTEDIDEYTHEDNDSLAVTSTHGFPSIGAVQVGNEIIIYSGKDATSFKNIIRGTPRDTADSGDTIVQVTYFVTPYLSEIITPSKKTKFTYEWWTKDDAEQYQYKEGIVALHEVYECGPTENYDGNPTIHIAWSSVSPSNQFTNITKYPTSVRDGAHGNIDDDPPQYMMEEPHIS